MNEYNRVFNAEEQLRLKEVIRDGCAVKSEIEVLTAGLRDTVKAIAEELDLKPGVLNKAITTAHKASWQDEAYKFDELEAILDAAGHRL